MHALWVLGVPLLLFIVGTIYHRALPLIIGSIGLIVFGVMLFISPIVVTQLANVTTNYSYANVSTASGSGYEWQLNSTIETNGYSQIPMSDNDNLMFGVLVSFLGIAGLGYSAAAKKR